MGRPYKGYKNAAGKVIPGVTTVISPYGDKGGLMHWAWKLGTQGINYREVATTGATIGTMAHELVECHVRKIDRAEWPKFLEADEEDVRRAWRAFHSYRRWHEQNKLEIIYAETPIVSEEMQVGGTPDAIAIEPEVGRVLLDWKTGNKVYTETLYQLAAYVMIWEETHPEDDPLQGIHCCRFGKDYGDFHHHAWPIDSLPVVNAKEGFKLLAQLHHLNLVVKKGI